MGDYTVEEKERKFREFIKLRAQKLTPWKIQKKLGKNEMIKLKISLKFDIYNRNLQTNFYQVAKN